MDQTEKVKLWLERLKRFAINAEIHCSREEKVIRQELIGTRHVNMAFNEMLRQMHQDFGCNYERVVDSPKVLKGGMQILLFAIGENHFYTDLSAIHEILSYPTQNYNQFTIQDNLPMVGILNWYEGMIPIIRTHELLNEKDSDESVLLVYDVGKEIYGFTVSHIYSKHEIESSLYGSTIQVKDFVFKYLDFNHFEKQLIATRMRLKL